MYIEQTTQITVVSAATSFNAYHHILSVY